MGIVQIDIWQLLGFAGSLLVALCGAGWVLITIIVKQFSTRLDEKFQGQEELRATRDAALAERFRALEAAVKNEGDGWRQLEREVMQLRGDLPLQYLRREDAIRQEVVIHSKLDALAAKIDALRAGG